MLAQSVDKLGQFPIVQIAIGFLIVIGGLLALRQGRRDNGKAAPPEVPEQRWYFDGPIKALLDALEGIYRETKEMRNESKEAAKERRDHHREHMEVMRDLTERLPRRRQ